MYCRNVDMMRMKDAHLIHPGFAEMYNAIILLWEQGNHRRQRVDVKYEVGRKVLLQPLIIPLSHAQSSHEERILYTAYIRLKCNVNKQKLAIRNSPVIFLTVSYQ